MKLLIAGASGLVGSRALDFALAEPRVESIVAPTRSPLKEHPKLRVERVDFEALPEDAAWWRVDAVICALGTTMRKAGSRAAFRRVDHDYPLFLARLARRHGAQTFVLNSAMGADPASRFFYNRVKGELEADLSQTGFRSLTFARPGLIGGEREELRPAERFAGLLLALLHPVLPRSLRINPAERIAQAMLQAALAARPGRHVVDSAGLSTRAAR